MQGGLIEKRAAITSSDIQTSPIEGGHSGALQAASPMRGPCTSVFSCVAHPFALASVTFSF